MKLLRLKVRDGKVDPLPLMTAEPVKRCPRCGVTKPRNVKHFKRHRIGGGWKPDCIACIVLKHAQRLRERGDI